MCTSDRLNYTHDYGYAAIFLLVFFISKSKIRWFCYFSLNKPPLERGQVGRHFFLNREIQNGYCYCAPTKMVISACIRFSELKTLRKWSCQRNNTVISALARVVRLHTCAYSRITHKQWHICTHTHARADSRITCKQ